MSTPSPESQNATLAVRTLTICILLFITHGWFDCFFPPIPSPPTYHLSTPPPVLAPSISFPTSVCHLASCLKRCRPWTISRLLSPSHSFISSSRHVILRPKRYTPWTRSASPFPSFLFLPSSCIDETLLGGCTPKHVIMQNERKNYIFSSWRDSTWGRLGGPWPKMV